MGDREKGPEKNEVAFDLASDLARFLAMFHTKHKSTSGADLSREQALLGLLICAYTTYRANCNKADGKDMFMDIAGNVYDNMSRKEGNGSLILLKTPMSSLDN